MGLFKLAKCPAGSTLNETKGLSELGKNTKVSLLMEALIDNDYEGGVRVNCNRWVDLGYGS
tara:strand:+ start:682 stop:864 length:183 start_codon:yes stop_codon:yes gene_type:complete